MNKKIISTALATLMIAGSTYFTAFASMTSGSVVIGNKAFDLEYANDPVNLQKIADAIIAGGEVYVKGFDGIWIDNNSGEPVDANVIPAVIYTNADKEINYDAQDKDVVDSSTIITFPDQNLEKEVRNEINKPTGDILKGDVDTITELNIPSKNITNLSGIEKLTSLTKLVLSYDQVSNIEPLRGLTNLKYLWLCYNRVSNIEPLKGLVNLNELYIQSNQINNIEPLRGLTNLTELDLDNNQISDMDSLRGMTKLTTLLSDNNQISNIDALRGITNLTQLFLDYNKISNIEPLKGLITLNTFSLRFNQVSNLDSLSVLTNLNRLYLEYNQITNIEPLRGLINLTELYLKGNQINDYTAVNAFYRNIIFKDFVIENVDPVGDIVANYKNRLDESYNLFTEPVVDTKIKELLGIDYDLFKDCMYSISTDIEYNDINKTYTIVGGKPGLFTIMEGIIQLDENGNIRLAFSHIDSMGNAIVQYYTTERGASDMPNEIKNWINEKFPDSILLQ
ncbi:MAG TPA: leucine-rich repeat domain-containing protein [Clostridium sp.]|uniref:leucine-rich repeat domain-containing protein n=1 Tax=Clostridium sp. TaxID=1506 RepID=UPI002F951744